MKLEISHDLKLPIEAVTQTFAILAKRGVGKTYAGAVMVEEMLAAQQQVVVADPVGVWWGLRSSADGKSPGFPIVVFGGEHGDVPLEEHAGEIVAQSIIENGFSAVLDLSLFRKGQQVRFMTAFAETLYRLNRKPLHFMVDEADEFAPQRPMHGTERLLGAFEDIVRRGRARGIGVTLITQRAAVLNKNVLTQIEVLVVLRTISPQDREAISAWTEVHGTKEQLRELAESVASLPIGTAWFWSPGWLDVFKKIQVRKKTTFDSSATPKVGEKVQRPKALADVNLEQLGAQIKATAEKAKENDPAELKKQLAAARKELSVLQQSKPIKEVPALTDHERTRLTRLIETHEKLESSSLKLAAAAESISTECQLNRLEVKSIKELLAGKLSTVAPRAVFPRLSPAIPARTVGRTTQNGDSGANDKQPGKGARLMLQAAAQHPDGVTDEQLAVLTGYKKTSRTTFKQQLFSAGCLSKGGRGFVATDQGLTWLGSDFEPLPTGEDLRNHWLRTLTGGELECFRVYVANYPSEVSAEQLMEATGYLKTSVTTFRQKLSARNLISGKTASKHLY